MSEPLDKDRLRQVKGMWGWGLAALWITYWWWHLQQVRQQALSEGCPESLVGKFGDALFGQGTSCLGSINGDFNNGLFFAVITSPVAFIVAHYYAKWRLTQIIANEDAMVREVSQKKDRDRQQAHAASVAEMSERAQVEQEVIKLSGTRFEVITRLGAVDDQLVVLENEAKAESVKLIKLNIGQSIRDIHAKFKEDELAALYNGDEGLRQRVDRTLAEMKRLGLAESRFHSELMALFNA